MGLVLGSIDGIDIAELASVHGVALESIAQINGVDIRFDWPTWPEQWPEAFADNGTFVCMFDDPSAAADETGIGGPATGSDLILTQVGSVPGYDATYTGREIGGSNYFTATQGLVSSMLSGASTWSLILKARNLSAPPEHAGIRLGSGGGADFLLIQRVSGGWQAQAIQNGGALISALLSVGAAYDTGDLWLGLWSDGSTVQFGLAAAKPNAIGGWGAVVSLGSAAAFGAWAETPHLVGNGYSEGTPHVLPGWLNYLVISTTCFF